MAAYVRFAQAHPAEYRVMFGAELASREDLPELNESALSAFGILREGIVGFSRAAHWAAATPDSWP